VAWLPSAGNRVDPEVEAIAGAAVQAMAREGASVETVQLDFVSLEKHFLVVLQSLLAARVGANLERFGNRLDASLIDAVQKGRRHTAVDLHEATFAKTRCFNELQALFERFDVLVSPTLSAPPLPIDMDVSGEIEIAGRPAGTVRGAWYPYTYPMNLTGHPALSMPCGRSAIGLPIGLQLVGRWYDDHYLLDVAALVEQALG
jgi:aspartyl-tRNA(Asn)/glutamyl-tRNA(Gln) amidotransferase subunit A